MVDLLLKALAKLPALGKDRSPNVAAAIGFCFGGLGLGLYFRSFIDFVLPVAITIGLVVMTGALGAAAASLGWLAGAITASLYGYYRAQQSNEVRSAVPTGSAPAMSRQ
jgi:hypothetical protein